MKDVTCIDLFCGAGGLTHGLQKEGIDVVAGVDVEESCRHPFEFNNAAKFIKEDVSKISGEQLNALHGKSEIRVLAGCAPCQPFSTYSQRYDVLSSPRWGLLYQFDRLVKETRPQIVTMENVPTVAKHAVFDDFANSLMDQGYYVYRSVIDCTKYGLPQTRRRMVLLASRLGPIEIVAPEPENRRTVRDAIGGLPALSNGEASHAAVSEELSCRLGSRRLASPDDKTQPLSLFQNITRDHPPGGDDVCPVPIVAAECGGFVARTGH